MKELIFLIKILLILAAIAIMAFPLFVEYRRFKNNAKKGISYKRFRIIVFTLVYIIAVTLALRIVKDLLIWFESLEFIKQIIDFMNKTFLSKAERFLYIAKLLITMAVNLAIGVLYMFFNGLVSLGLEKKDLKKPKGKDGSYTLGQRIERSVIKFFFTETWFLVGRVFKWLAFGLSAAYAVVFFLYQLPAYFGNFLISFDSISKLFSAGYIYPVITLIAMYQIYFFLAGMERLDEECPDLLKEELIKQETGEIDLTAVDKLVRDNFNNFYACDLDLSARVRTELDRTDHTEVAKYIAQAIENDERNPHPAKEVYMNCIDVLDSSEKSVLVNGTMFSDFAMYFIRYLSIIVARGDNIVFVCNEEAQIEDTYNYINKALAEMTSLYCDGTFEAPIDFDYPIWRVIKISGDYHDFFEENTVSNNSILVTSLAYLCSENFESEHKRFIHLLDTVIFVDALETVNKYNRQLSIFNTKLKQIARINSRMSKDPTVNKEFSVRYMPKPVRYICFDNLSTPGLDKVLKNLLDTDFETTDVRWYKSSSLVRCYKYEPSANDLGETTVAHFLDTKEEIGPLVNMALLCLSQQVSDVTIFTGNKIPYGNIVETLASHSGQIQFECDADRIKINKHHYNTNDYSVIIAMDSDDNLLASLRLYLSMTPNKPTLVIVFARNYMLRDYYLGNLEELWLAKQHARIPVEGVSKRDISQQILIKANSGGISEDELLSLAGHIEDFADYVSRKDYNGLLKEVLKVYKYPTALLKFFRFDTVRDFDEKGEFVSETRISVKPRSELYERINGRDMITMVVGDEELVLPMPKCRLTQNYIADQNLLFEGNIYRIEKIDIKNARIYAHRAVGAEIDEPYQYIQMREYHVEQKPKVSHIVPNKHLVMNRSENGISVNEVFVSVFRASMEVMTDSYYEIDPHTMSKCFTDGRQLRMLDEQAVEVYRRYGEIEAPRYSTGELLNKTELNVSQNGVLMMLVRLCGSFGEDFNKTMALSAAMLNESLQAMFPSVADSISVCPVFKGELTKDDADVLAKLPRLTVTGEGEITSGNDFQLLIIEDCVTDLGVVSLLATSGDDILHTLFEPILRYLDWYEASDRQSKYLFYGKDHEPSCFDFRSTHTLARLLGGNAQELHFVNLDTVLKYTTCDFCGGKFSNADDVSVLEDGRKICKNCQGSIVGNNKSELRECFNRAKRFLESTYGIIIDDSYEVCFESTLKIANALKKNPNFNTRGSDVPLRSYIDDDRKIHAEYSIPSASLSELLVRELTHLWQRKNIPNLEENLAEGHIAFVDIQYMKFLGKHALASSRTAYYESNYEISGEGYRKLIKGLAENPIYRNNPFKYLLGKGDGGGGGEEGREEYQDLFISGEKTFSGVYFGKPYQPKAKDRKLSGQPEYFYRSKLNQPDRDSYDRIVEAVKKYEKSVELCAGHGEPKKIMEAVLYDHPELFWFSWGNLQNSHTLLPIYCVTPEEAKSLQQSMEPVIAKYLEGVEDNMSAYDVAIRLHVKMAAAVDYDTIALNQEKRQGGPKNENLDYLRSICGVFINGKCVCEGYARAMVYLLQKCGIEAAEAAGAVKTASGRSDAYHAWVALKIDGQYYYSDPTWDDRSNTDQAVKNTDIGLKYFCITTEELYRTRDTILCPTAMPIFTATDANYYYHNGFVIDSYDLDKIKSIAKIFAANDADWFSIKCKTKAVYDQAFLRLCISGSDCDEIIRAARKENKKIDEGKYQYYYDPDLWVITIKFNRK